jgi:hypothetical protein
MNDLKDKTAGYENGPPDLCGRRPVRRETDPGNRRSAAYFSP